VGDGEHDGQYGEGGGEHHCPQFLGQETPDAAKQADQRKRADARNARAFRLLSTLPTALEADQQAQCKRDA
jgi:hypothetical protein